MTLGYLGWQLHLALCDWMEQQNWCLGTRWGQPSCWSQQRDDDQWRKEPKYHYFGQVYVHTLSSLQQLLTDYVIGKEVTVADEIIVRNCIVLPHKELKSSYHSEILM